MTTGRSLGRNMEGLELLTVADCFQLSNIGLVVVPDFAVPPGHWKNFSDTVIVLRPDRREFEETAEFKMSHFDICDPNVSMDKRWRIVVSLPNVRKEDVPVGSKILVSQETGNAVLIGNAA